jgi:hypothetical protein
VTLLLLAGIAHTQPANWTIYEQGDTRHYQGTDAQGRQWTGKSHLHWGMRFYAQPANWTSYEQGDTRYYQGTDAQGRQWTGKSHLHWGPAVLRVHRAVRRDRALPRV